MQRWVRWAVKKGQVIFLNGTSSSGKTTIAKALQQRLAEPYLLASVDEFFRMLPEKFLDAANPAEARALPQIVAALISGFHRTIAALAQSGNNVIVDHVLQEPGWLEECVAQWGGLEVLFVGVFCPLAVAEQREKERGDREVGTARFQWDRVHRHGKYDIVVDTSIFPVDVCVDQIIAMIENKPDTLVFPMLAARYAREGAGFAGENED